MDYIKSINLEKREMLKSMNIKYNFEIYEEYINIKYII